MFCFWSIATSPKKEEFFYSWNLNNRHVWYLGYKDMSILNCPLTKRYYPAEARGLGLDSNVESTYCKYKFIAKDSRCGILRCQQRMNKTHSDGSSCFRNIWQTRLIWNSLCPLYRSRVYLNFECKLLQNAQEKGSQVNLNITLQLDKIAIKCQSQFLCLIWYVLDAHLLVNQGL